MNDDDLIEENEDENTVSEDIVAIFDDETFEQLVETISPMRVGVKEGGKVTRFQVEDGTTRTDHFVVEPVELQIDFLLSKDTRNEYQAIKDIFNAKKLITVQTKVTSYTSMILEELPHEENVDLGNVVLMPLRFVEWRPVKTQMAALSSAKKSKMGQQKVKRGQQQTTAANPAQEKKAKASVLGVQIGRRI
jgi:hypothetical protein